MRARIFKFLHYNRKKSIFFSEERGHQYNFFEKLWLYLNLGRRVEIPFIDLDVNTACNLNCEKCAKYIPYHQKREIYSAEEVIEGLKILLERIDKIYALSIIGGEPFLNPDIAEVIRFCSSCEKIGDFDITTNGTVLPEEATFQVLAHSRAFVYISVYPGIGEKRETIRAHFIETLKRYGIPFRLIQHEHWLDFGEMTCHHFSEGVKKAMFFRCPMNSCSVYRCRTLYRCGRSCYLSEHGILPADSSVVYVDKVKDKREMRRKLRAFYSRPYLPACDYCARKPAHVLPGQQMPKRQKGVRESDVERTT